MKRSVISCAFGQYNPIRIREIIPDLLLYQKNVKKTLLEKICKTEESDWDRLMGAHRLIGTRPVEDELTKIYVIFLKWGSHSQLP